MRKAGLTISEYYILTNVLTDVFNSSDGVTYALCNSVANWCWKNGLNVTDLICLSAQWKQYCESELYY